jgi:hypothetical protein
MKRVTYMLLATSLLFLINSCCNCTNEEQIFSADESVWMLDGEIGDSLVFTNDQGETKTFYINSNLASFSKEKCAGPCCVCPEDNAAFYDFALTGDHYEGLTINLTKTNNVFQKTFAWGYCDYSSFHDFDYSLDSITVQNRLYHDILVKDLNVCKIRKIFFCKGIGLIRFDYDDGKWERSN